MKFSKVRLAYAQFLVVQWGNDDRHAKRIARGIFSNESGLGSAPIAAAAAQSKEPVRQGLVSMTGTFIDTLVVCNMTGMAIILTGAWETGLEGSAVTILPSQKHYQFRKPLRLYY